jgi:hypothetical protein
LELCETLADPLQPCVAIFNGGWVRVFQREPVFDRYADGIALFDPVGHNVHPQEAIRYCSIVPPAGIEYMLSLLTLVIEAVSLVDPSA